MSPDDAADKSALRARVRAARRARTPQQRGTDAEALTRVVMGHPLVRAADVVAVYDSTPTEPGTGPLRAALSATGATALLPVVRGEGPLAWIGPDGAERDLADADVVLLPALAVDLRGHRLGQGGGHYDRTLAELATRRTLPPLVVLVHDEEVLEGAAVPHEPHDARVTGAATPRRWVDLAAPRTAPGVHGESPHG